MAEHIYHLQKYGGVSTRYTCPKCGRKRCFTLYVDENNQKLHDTVGKCDHDSSCKYHYTPRQYFADHPEARSGPSAADSQSGPPRSVMPCHDRASQKPLCTIPIELVERSCRPAVHSHLTLFLSTFLDPLVLEQVVEAYKVGVTRGRDTIFFQIDAYGRCRTGKIMRYNPDTGHRVKDPDCPGRIDWVHSALKRTHQLPDKWELTQCLFGEHLLLQYPEMPVALVESEKTALICAALMPQALWLATGGKTQLSESRLSVLRGRRVTAFPDIDAYEEWQRKLSALEGYNIVVSNLLEKNASPEDRAAQIDIADWLIRWKQGRPIPVPIPKSILAVLDRIPEDRKQAFLDLVSDFDLVPVMGSSMRPP